MLTKTYNTYITLSTTRPYVPQSIEQRIVEEYQRMRNDAAYQRERRRVNYLHRKLTHIKRMVHQYDHLVSCAHVYYLEGNTREGRYHLVCTTGVGRYYL